MTSPTEFDLVVIGTGAGGSAPAHRCAAAGWKVAIVDEQPFGGTCALRGCDPKKVLVGAADLLDWHRRMAGHGIAGDPRINWSALMEFKDSFVRDVPGQRERSLVKAGIQPFRGHARFTGPDSLDVGGSSLRARKFVIAAGAVPRTLNISGEEHVRTSADFLELRSLPRRIAFIGAGFIGLELAHVAARAGADVTVLGRERPLPRFDPDLVDVLLRHSQRPGLQIRTDCNVVGVARTAAGLTVHFDANGTRGAVPADLVIHAAGRVPATGGLDAEAGGIALGEEGAILVNEYLQSVSNERVYAAGDVTLPSGSLPLTPVGSHEARVVASNLLDGNSHTADYSAIPSVVFTVPPLAALGLSEGEARARGLPIEVKSGYTGGWYTNRRVNSPIGMFKTVRDADTDLLLGVHLLGQGAEELINVFATAMRHRIPVRELRRTVFAYPTGASDLASMV